MSALAIILTVAMAVPGNGPEKVSGEIAEPQRLDLSGEWEVIAYRLKIEFKGEACIKEDGEFPVTRREENGEMTFHFGRVIDEGNGQLRMGGCLGIYRQNGNQVRICLGEPPHRPTSFRRGDSEWLLILHRVKPRK